MAWFQRKKIRQAVDACIELIKTANPASRDDVQASVDAIVAQGWHDEYGSEGLTLLHALAGSAKPGLDRVIQRLLDAGAAANVPWAPSRTGFSSTPERIFPYIQAVVVGNVASAGVLRPVTSLTPEHQAWLWNHALFLRKGLSSVFDTLVAHNISPMAECPPDLLWFSAQTPDLPKLHAQFPELSLDRTNSHGETALVLLLREWSFQADHIDHEDITARIHWLLDQGANPRVVSHRGVGAVCQAVYGLARSPHLLPLGFPVVQRLLEGGAPWCLVPEKNRPEGNSGLLSFTALCTMTRNPVSRKSLLQVLQALDWPMSVWTRPQRFGQNWEALCREFPDYARELWQLQKGLEAKSALQDALPVERVRKRM